MRQAIALICSAILFATGCGDKVTRGADGADGLTRTRKASRVIRGLEQSAFTAEWVEGNAKIDLKSEKLTIGGSATIRLHRDEAIWISVKKFGLEGARVLIRPDSFFVTNRLTGEYIAEPLSYIERKYQVPARFDLLQEIALGNAVFFSRNLELATEGERYRLTGEDRRYATEHLVDGRGLRLLAMDVREKAGDRTVRIENDDFRGVSGSEGRFAHERRIQIESEETGPASARLNFSRVKLDGPFRMPFSFR